MDEDLTVTITITISNLIVSYEYSNSITRSTFVCYRYDTLNLFVVGRRSLCDFVELKVVVEITVKQCGAINNFQIPVNLNFKFLSKRPFIPLLLQLQSLVVQHILSKPPSLQKTMSNKLKSFLC